MPVDDVPLMSMLKERMAWLSRRQELLSQNIASADVQGYTPRDLKPMDFEETLRSASQQNSSAGTLMVTNPRHIAPPRSEGFAEEQNRDVESSPNGNSVSLEAEMIKVSDTQAQYQAAVNIYGKAITMMKTAIGRGGA